MFKGKGLRKGGCHNTGFYGCFRPGSSVRALETMSGESIVVPEGNRPGAAFRNRK